jgi:hypothetical protein
MLDNQFQSAYKSGHSTETALVNIKSDIGASLAKVHPTALVMFDLSLFLYTLFYTLILHVILLRDIATLGIIFMLMTLKYIVIYHHLVNHQIVLIYKTVYRTFKGG